MTVAELKEILGNYPEEMDVVLVDINDDSEETGGVYAITEQSVSVIELTKHDEEEPYLMDGLCISFANRHLDSLTD